VEFLYVDLVRKLRVELVFPIPVTEKILLQRLIAVERLADVRHRRMKVFFDYLQIDIAPKSVDNCILGRATVRARGNKAKNLSSAPRRPRIGSERTGPIAKDLHR